MTENIDHLRPPSNNPPMTTSRVLSATRERVFGAFSDEATLAKWWGPNGFKTSFTTFDFQTGGVLNLVMRGADETDYAITYQCVEVVYPERIVLHNPQPMHEFDLTITLAEAENKTLLTWTMQFDSGEEAERVRSFVTEANEQNLDRLEAQLATMA